jgi:hypothetical protein
MTCYQSVSDLIFLPKRLGEVRWGLRTVSINPPFNLPPIFLSFTQNSDGFLGPLPSRA